MVLEKVRLPNLQKAGVCRQRQRAQPREAGRGRQRQAKAGRGRAGRGKQRQTEAKAAASRQCLNTSNVFSSLAPDTPGFHYFLEFCVQNSAFECWASGFF